MIIPCHPRNLPTLGRATASLETAAEGFDVECITVIDGDSRGLSWARNRGIDRATGDVVMFLDADDTVRKRFFAVFQELFEKSDCDFAISSFGFCPLKRNYDIEGNAEIRDSVARAFFGYSFDDVLRWNAGGSLDALRELGCVCRCAFKMSFLETHKIRFDERLAVFEDSPFIAECACFAGRVSSTKEIVYEYEPADEGLMRRSMKSRVYLDYKFSALANRKAIAARSGGDVIRYFEASAVFSLLELFVKGGDWRNYLKDDFVRSSLAAFPLSVRHPLAAAAVMFMRFAALLQRR